jgi:hypothetical protein
MPSEVRQTIAKIVSEWAVEHGIYPEQDYGAKVVRALINEIADWVEEYMRRGMGS